MKHSSVCAYDVAFCLLCVAKQSCSVKVCSSDMVQEAALLPLCWLVGSRAPAHTHRGLCPNHPAGAHPETAHRDEGQALCRQTAAKKRNWLLPSAAHYLAKVNIFSLLLHCGPLAFDVFDFALQHSAQPCSSSEVQAIISWMFLPSQSLFLLQECCLFVLFCYQSKTGQLELFFFVLIFLIFLFYCSGQEEEGRVLELCGAKNYQDFHLDPKHLIVSKCMSEQEFQMPRISKSSKDISVMSSSWLL